MLNKIIPQNILLFFRRQRLILYNLFVTKIDDGRSEAVLLANFDSLTLRHVGLESLCYLEIQPPTNYNVCRSVLRFLWSVFGCQVTVQRLTLPAQFKHEVQRSTGSLHRILFPETTAFIRFFYELATSRPKSREFEVAISLPHYTDYQKLCSYLRYNQDHFLNSECVQGNLEHPALSQTVLRVTLTRLFAMPRHFPSTHPHLTGAYDFAQRRVICSLVFHQSKILAYISPSIFANQGHGVALSKT